MNMNMIDNKNYVKSKTPLISTGVALYADGRAISQLWMFWVAWIIGAVLGGLVYRFIGGNDE